MEHKSKQPEGNLSLAEDGNDIPAPDSLAYLTIIQSVDDDGFEPIKAWLQADPRVSGEITENGRYYTVPDGDDLPEWFAIRISTTPQHRESLKADLQRMIDSELNGSFKVEYF